jgi:hypothetical protein
MKRFFLMTISALILFGSFCLQEDGLQILKKKFSEFNSTYKRAKLDLLFNQSKYTQGDTAFYRAYYLRASDLRFIKGQEIIHIKLFDHEGVEVLANELLVKDGHGSSGLVFPNDILPGSYLLVAYSSWMKNLDNSLFFRREISIVGRRVLKENRQTSIPTIEFYPEGGNLIAGIESNIVFRLKNIEFSGELHVKNASGDIVAKSLLDDSGLADIKIKLEANQKHIIEYVLRGSPVSKLELPFPKPDGFTVQVLFSDGKPSQLIVLSSKGMNLTKKRYVLLTSADKVIFSCPLYLIEGESKIQLPKKLPRGISQLCVFDEDLSVLAERLVFIEDNDKINVGLDMSNRYSTREQVDIKILICDGDSIPIDGQFSVRVFNSDMLKPEGYSIVNNLLISSDLLEGLPKTNTISTDKINRFLVTQKCYWLNWASIMRGLKPIYSHQTYQTFSGKAYQLNPLVPLKDSTLLQFFLQGQVLGYEGYIWGGGHFKIPLVYNLFGREKVFYSASYKGRDVTDFVLSVDKDSVTDFRSYKKVELDAQDTYGTYAQKKRVIDQSFNFYSSQSTSKKSQLSPNELFEEELGGSDVTVNLKDYVVFPTMSELIREVVRSVEHRKIKGKDVIRVYTTQKRPSNFSQPLFIINGVLTKNTNVFLGLNPEEILTLKIIKDSNKLTRFGSLGENGVIIVDTRNSNPIDESMKTNTFTFSGLADTVSVRPLRKQVINFPDLRACLYWNPRVTIDAKGKVSFNFLTSDKLGNYLVQIQGLTNDGRLFLHEKSFTVEYK